MFDFILYSLSSLAEVSETTCSVFYHADKVGVELRYRSSPYR